MSLKYIFERGVCQLHYMFIGLVFMTCAAAQTTTEKLDQCRQLEDDDPTRAIEIATTLLTDLDASTEAIQYGHALGCLGWSLAAKDQVDQARSRTIELEELAAQLPNSQDSIRLIRRAGGIFHRLGDRISATKNYSAAMQVATDLELKSEQIPLLVNLGVLYSEIREHDNAINAYYLALDLMEELQDFRYQPPALYNLGLTLNGQNRAQEALDVLLKVEQMMSEQWPQSRRASVQAGLGAAHLGLQDYPQAQTYLSQALTLFETLPDSLEKMSAKTNYARVLFAVGEIEQAQQFADQARQFFIDQQQAFEDGATLYTLARVYQSLEDQESALELMQQARRKDRQYNQSFNQETMAQMQARLEDSQQRQELAELKNANMLSQMRLDEVQRQRWLWIISLIAFAAVLGAFMFWQSRMNRKLQRITRRDMLTGIGNRRAIEHWRRERFFPNPPTARLMWLIDLDHFKRVNDSFGHDMGDVMLQQVAAQLREQMDSDRFVGRWGGEEFMFLTEDISLDDLHVFADKIRQCVEAIRIDSGDSTISITASLGVSRIQDSSKEAWNAALAEADAALYKAKAQGRNQTVSQIS